MPAARRRAGGSCGAGRAPSSGRSRERGCVAPRCGAPLYGTLDRMERMVRRGGWRSAGLGRDGVSAGVVHAQPDRDGVSAGVVCAQLDRDGMCAGLGVRPTRAGWHVRRGGVRPTRVGWRVRRSGGAPNPRGMACPQVWVCAQPAWAETPRAAAAPLTLARRPARTPGTQSAPTPTIPHRADETPRAGTRATDPPDGRTPLRCVDGLVPPATSHLWYGNGPFPPARRRLWSRNGPFPPARRPLWTRNGSFPSARRRLSYRNGPSPPATSHLWSRNGRFPPAKPHL